MQGGAGVLAGCLGLTGLGLLVGVQAPAAREAPARALQAPAPRAGIELVGTWLLTRAERLDATGEAEAVSSPRGLLVLDGEGYAIEIVTRGGRTPSATFQVTPEEAQSAFTDFGGFWGRYRAGRVAGQDTITYRVEAAVDPNLYGDSLVRTYALAGDRVTMTSTRARPDAPGGMRWEWQRVPNLDVLTPAHRELVGFWRHVVERRETLSGEVLSENRRDPSIIVYTPAGFVGVHFPPLDRQPYAGNWPSDQAAQEAIRGYVGYYGTFSLHPGTVFHHRLALLGRAQGDTLRRFFQIDFDEPSEAELAAAKEAEEAEDDEEEELEIPEDQITLRLPPGQFQGQTSRTIVVLRRLSGEPEMLGQIRERNTTR